MKLLLIAFMIILVLSLLIGCSPKTQEPQTDGQPSAESAPVTDEQTESSVPEQPAKDALGYEQITPEAAKAIMDSGDAHIILDVRTVDEFETGHIERAILIPDFEIEEKAASMLPDKDALILVYCRSGRRSKEASSTLAKLGYTNVKEFGGINDWPYETAVVQSCGGA